MVPFEFWRSIRKTALSISVGMGRADFTNTLSATGIEFRTAPRLEISMDLNSNLRTRHKTSNSYCDAHQLARGDITHLRYIQFMHTGIVERLIRNVRLYALPTDRWGLRILLCGEHHFDVRPEIRDGALLTLRVLPRPTLAGS